MATPKTLNQKWYILGTVLNFKGIYKTLQNKQSDDLPQTNETARQ